MATNSIDIGVALHGFGIADEAFGVLSNSLDRVRDSANNLTKTFKKFDASDATDSIDEVKEAIQNVHEAMGDFATTGLTLIGTKLNDLSKSKIAFTDSCNST